MPTYGYAPVSNLRVQMYQLRDMLGEPWDFAKEDPLAATPGYFRDRACGK